MTKISTLLILFLTLFSITSNGQIILQDDAFLQSEGYDNTPSGQQRSLSGMIPIYDSIMYYEMDIPAHQWQSSSKDNNFIYDNHGNKIQSENYQCHAGYWYYNSKTKFGYDGNNRLIRKTSFNSVNDTMNDMFAEFDEYGNRIYYMTKTRFVGYYMNYREIRTYSNNRLLSYTVESRFFYDDSLETTKYTYSYNDDKLSEELTQKLQNNIWVDNSKRIYSYNTNGKTSEILTQNIVGGVWINRQKVVFEYDPEDNISSRTTLDFTDGDWINYMRLLQTYNGTKLGSREQQKWIEQSWVTNYTDIFTYDANLNLTHFISHELVEGEMRILQEFWDTFDNDNIITTSVDYIYDIYDPAVPLMHADSTVFTFQKVLSFGEKEVTGQLALYPNPTNGLLQIKTTSPIIRKELYNLSGKHIVTINSPSSALDISSQPAGFYILKVITSKETVTRKILKTN